MSREPSNSCSTRASFISQPALANLEQADPLRLLLALLVLQPATMSSRVARRTTVAPLSASGPLALVELRRSARHRADGRPLGGVHDYRVARQKGVRLMDERRGSPIARAKRRLIEREVGQQERLRAARPA